MGTADFSFCRLPLNAATFLTDDEKRAAAGYGAKAESEASGDARTASIAAKFNPNHDELGRFTFTDGGGSGGAISGGEGSDAPTGDPGNDRVAMSKFPRALEMLKPLLRY